MISTVHILVISLFFVLSNGSVSMHNPFYCYSEDPIRPQILMFGTEAPYERIRGQIDPNVSSCTPSKFWLVGRNGQRLPNGNELRVIFQHSETLHRNILNNYDAGRTSLCASDISLIRNWRLDPNITYGGSEQYLIVPGWNEVIGIAQRFQLAFPTLLPPVYSPTHYLFRSTDIPAMITSLHAFADGLFGHDEHQEVEFENFDDPDLLLRSLQNCPLLEEITSLDIEENAFAEGPEYQEMLTQVSSKFGFHASNALSEEQIETLLTLCRHEQIWNLNSTSPLCAAFSVANHQVLEYRRCLFTYYRYGWGFTPSHSQFFKNLPCHLVQDMLHFLRSNDPSDNQARIFNTVGAQIALVLHALGAYNDDDVPLTRHNFAQKTFRHYRSSYIYATAHNLAVIRYDCADGDHDVLFLHSERPLRIPGCQSNGVCKLSMLLDRFRQYLDVNCTEVFCRNSEHQL